MAKQTPSENHILDQEGPIQNHLECLVIRRSVARPGFKMLVESEGKRGVPAGIVCSIKINIIAECQVVSA